MDSVKEVICSSIREMFGSRFDAFKEERVWRLQYKLDLDR